MWLQFTRGAHAGDVASYDNIIGDAAALKRQGTSRRGSLKAAIECAKNAQNNKNQPRLNPFGDSPEVEENIYLMSTGHAVGRQSPDDGYEKINEEAASTVDGYERITAEDVESVVTDQHPSAVNHQFDSLFRLKQAGSTPTPGASDDNVLDELYAQRSAAGGEGGETSSTKLDTRAESDETGASVDFINDQFCKNRNSIVAKDFI